MNTVKFYGLLIALATLSLALPGHAPAQDRRYLSRPQQLGPAVGYHRYTPPPPEPAVGYHSHTPPAPAPPLRHYPHGHRLHVHDHWCPVVIRPHVHIVAPVWRVSTYPQPFRTGQAILQISVTATEGEIYVDDDYLGSAASLQGRLLEFPVFPGRHTVYFVYGGHVHPREVHIEVDSTAVVQASLQ